MYTLQKSNQKQHTVCANHLEHMRPATWNGLEAILLPLIWSVLLQATAFHIFSLSPLIFWMDQCLYPLSLEIHVSKLPADLQEKYTFSPGAVPPYSWTRAKVFLHPTVCHKNIIMVIYFRYYQNIFGHVTQRQILPHQWNWTFKLHPSCKTFFPPFICRLF